MNEKKILQKINKVEAAASHFIEEASELKQMLGGVSTPPNTRKGRIDKKVDSIIARLKSEVKIKHQI